MRDLGQIYDNIPRPRQRGDIMEIGTVKSVDPLAIEIEGQRYSSEYWPFYLPIGLAVNAGDLVSIIDRGNNFIIFNKVERIGGSK